MDNNSSYQKSIPASQTKIKKPFKSAGGRMKNDEIFMSSDFYGMEERLCAKHWYTKLNNLGSYVKLTFANTVRT